MKRYSIPRGHEDPLADVEDENVSMQVADMGLDVGEEVVAEAALTEEEEVGAEAKAHGG